MGIRFLVNIGLLAIPVATTIGILLGLQSHRISKGQSPLFVDNGVTKTRYCQKSYGISPPATGQEYTLNPNQWGWTEGQPGSLCMNVTSFNNHTYATNTRAPEFSVTWLYPQGPESAPVHAFPNIKVDGTVLPTPLQSLNEINVDVEWTYGVGNKTAASTNVQQLTSSMVNANVAIDMFLDSDKIKAQDSAKATYEVMVWLAAFGDATQPIGLAQGEIATEVLNGTSFSLYHGQNSLDQHVLTWAASEPTEKFNGDISPLITRLFTMTGTGFPDKSDYLGYMGLGSEALWAQSTATFYVPVLSIDIQASRTNA